MAAAVTFAEFIAEWQKTHDATNAEVAQALGVTERTITRWRNGYSSPRERGIIKRRLKGLLGYIPDGMLAGEAVCA